MTIKSRGFWVRLANFATRMARKNNVQFDEPVQFSNPGFDDKYIFDFKPMFTAPQQDAQFNFGHLNLNNPAEVAVAEFLTEEDRIKNNKNKQPLKIGITPKQALKELETVPTPFSLTNLDDKITVLKDKEKLIRQSYANNEVKALIERLENRKKYPEHKNFFDSFQNTTQEKIDILLQKTGLVMKTSDIFIPEFPDDAVQVMTEYTNMVVKVTGKKPVFYVIADAKEFRSAYEKRDPILLVQSPFGFFWQILGAWDEEMLLLSEL